MSIPLIDELARTRAEDMRRRPRGPSAADLRSSRAAAGGGHHWFTRSRARRHGA